MTIKKDTDAQAFLDTFGSMMGNMFGTASAPAQDYSANLKVNVKKLNPRAKLPVYGTDGAGCFDISASNIDATKYKTKMDFQYSDQGATSTWTTEIEPTQPEVLFGTDLAFEIPVGHVMLVFSRSGHGAKNSIRLSNCVGVIDSDYRGELFVKLTLDNPARSLQVSQGDRIAQALIIPFPRVQFNEVEELSDTERGQGGFGSTGVK